MVTFLSCSRSTFSTGLGVKDIPFNSGPEVVKASGVCVCKGAGVVFRTCVLYIYEWMREIVLHEVGNALSEHTRQYSLSCTAVHVECMCTCCSGRSSHVTRRTRLGPHKTRGAHSREALVCCRVVRPACVAHERVYVTSTHKKSKLRAWCRRPPHHEYYRAGRRNNKGQPG